MSSGVRPGITRIREAKDLATALGAGVNGYAVTYQHSTGLFVLSPAPGGGGGITDHALLSNLAYATSGHTGFAGTGVANTFTQSNTFNQNITVVGDVIVGDDISVTDDIVAGGDVTAASIISPLLTSGSNVDITVNPGGTGALVLDDSTVFRSATFDSSFPIGGFRLGPTSLAGQFGFTVGEIQADVIRTVTFVADETRVDRANQYWTKSYGQLAEGFTSPASIGGTVTIKFEDSPSIAGALATNNDYVLFRTVEVGTGLTIQQSWGQLTTYTDNGNGTQSWTFTLRSGDVNAPYVSGATGVIFGASGAAYIHLSVNDIAGAPYLKGRRWVTNPYTPGNHTTYWQIGTLGGTANPNYTPVGNGIYARSGASANQFIVIDDNGLQIRNTDLKMYNGGSQVVDIASATGSLRMGTNVSSPATTGFFFDGGNGNVIIGGASYSPTVTIYGVVNIKSGSQGITNLTDAGALATANNLDGVPNGSTYQRTTANQVTGADRAYNALDGSNRLVTAVIPATAVTPSGAGLYLSSTHMGYYSGSEWKTYTDSSGNMRLQGSGPTNYIQWAAASNKLQGVGSSIEKWYASATDGVLYAGAGAVWMDQNGYNINVTQFGNADLIRFMRTGSVLASMGFQRATGGGPLTTDGMVFTNNDNTKFRFIGASVMEIGTGGDTAVNITGGISATKSGGFASLTVTRGLLSAAATLGGTTHTTIFSDGANEHTHIRGGKASSNVYINDTSGLGDVLLANGGGKVGVGITGPTYKLEALAPSGVQNIMRIAQDTVSDGLQITSNGSALTYKFNDGSVGIGVTPSRRLHVHGPTGTYLRVSTTDFTTGLEMGFDGTKAYIWNYENTDLQFATNSAAAFTIKASGDVDMGGVSSPTWRFNAIDGVGQLSLNPDFSGVNYLSSYISGVAGPLGLYGSRIFADADTFGIANAKTPASATDTGTTGMICWNSTHLFVCIATNTWRRIAHATW